MQIVSLTLYVTASNLFWYHFHLKNHFGKNKRKLDNHVREKHFFSENKKTRISLKNSKCLESDIYVEVPPNLENLTKVFLQEKNLQKN